MLFFRKRIELVVMCSLVSIGWMCCIPAIAEPIVYQGQLTMDGDLAQGDYDLEVRLFDAVASGSQIGKTIVIEDHPVSNGLFELELDFGDVFDSTNVYLEIAVRDGFHQGAMDVLSPRQRIHSIPKAMHATTADSLLGGNWNSGFDLFGARILWFGAGADRVLINREDPVSKNEYFGVHVEDAGIGGMVISNPDPNAITLLTHAPGNMPRASESFNGLTREWLLEIERDIVLAVNSAGVTAALFEYKAPVAGAVTVAGDAFHSALGTPFRASFFGGGAYLSTPGDNAPMVAPISLPNGAVVTRIVARFEDNTSSDLAISLLGALPDASLVTVGSVSSEGMPPISGVQSQFSDVIDPDNATVDTFASGYYLRAFSASWPGDSSLRIWSVTVEYTVSRPD